MLHTEYSSRSSSLHHGNPGKAWRKSLVLKADLTHLLLALFRIGGAGVGGNKISI